LASVAATAGAQIVTVTSLKAALDLDWDDPEARTVALCTVLQALNSVESWVEQKNDLETQTTTQVNKSLKDARQIEAQDVEAASDGSPKLRKGVAKDRRISIEDEDMRHGRKSRNQKVDGYKRHVLKDLDLEMVRAVGVTRVGENLVKLGQPSSKLMSKLSTGGGFKGCPSNTCLSATANQGKRKKKCSFLCY